MRNLLLLLCISVLIASCRKSYTCNCYNSNNTTQDKVYTVKAASSFEADISCIAHNDDTLSCSIN